MLLNGFSPRPSHAAIGAFTAHSTEPLSHLHRRALDNLLKLRTTGKITFLAWLRQSLSAPDPKHMLNILNWLGRPAALDLPDGIERQVHQNRLFKMAREGSHMTSSDLAKFELSRRYASLVAVVLEPRPRYR